MQQSWKVSECVTASYEILTWNEIYVFWTCVEQHFNCLLHHADKNVFTLFDTKPTHFQLNRFHDKPTGHLKKTTRYYISSLVIGLQQCNLNNDVTIYLPLITLFHRDNIQEVSTLP